MLHEQPYICGLYKIFIMFQRKILIVILLTGFLLRFIFCFWLHLPHLHTDTFMYFSQATAFEHGEYINYAPNGYPFIIALIREAFNFLDQNMVLLWMNIIFGTASIWLVHQIAFQVFAKKNIALLAAALMAIYPNQLNYTRWILTEIPCVFFILVSYYAYLSKRHFWGGVLLGMASLIRTTLIPVGLLIVVYELIIHKKIAFRLILGMAIPLLLLATYSYTKTNSFSITGNETVNIIYAVSSYTPASQGEIDWNAPKKHPDIKTSGEAWKFYFDHAKQNPGEFFHQRLSSLWELWGFYPSSLGGTRSIVSRLVIGLCNFLLTFGSGWCIWKNRNNSKVFLILFPFISLTAIHTLLVSLARYTVPMEPFLLILTSWTIAGLCFKKVKKPELVSFAN